MLDLLEHLAADVVLDCTLHVPVNEVPDGLLDEHLTAATVPCRVHVLHLAGGEESERHFAEMISEL